MTKLTLTLALSAALAASPVSAQEGNQANVTDAPTTVVAGPEAVIDNVAQPALPATDETTAAPAGAVETVAAPAPQPRRDDDDGFPWGVLGLIGLIGLLGRARG